MERYEIAHEFDIKVVIKATLKKKLRSAVLLILYRLKIIIQLSSLIEYCTKETIYSR